MYGRPRICARKTFFFKPGVWSDLCLVEQDQTLLSEKQKLSWHRFLFAIMLSKMARFMPDLHFLGTQAYFGCSMRRLVQKKVWWFLMQISAGKSKKTFNSSFMPALYLNSHTDSSLSALTMGDDMKYTQCHPC